MKALQGLLAWLDNRTGYQKMMHEALCENVPSGARWRYVTGSMLVFAFTVQAITGIFLWMAYSPSSQTAWESVYYIQHEMTGGWLVRGIHHFMAQAMVVVLGLHLLQVVVDGAYRAPREVNYWLGLILMQVTLGLGLTGYLLPWDQKGYWATNVATNLMTLVPFCGAELQQIVVGGKEYGHATLTRFFALHAGVLPGTLVAFLALHIMVFRRHGITAHITPGRKDQAFFPSQVLLDSLACLAMLLVVVLCVIKFDLGGLLSGRILQHPGHLGAELGAPADPSEAYSAARPEWYYLFLFQLLKFFEGSTEWIGALVLPGAVMGLLFLFPIIGRSQTGHKINIAIVLLLIGGAVVLTIGAIVDDNYHVVAAKLGLSNEKKISSAKEFAVAKEEAERNAARTIELVNRRQMVDGKLSAPMLIPKQGAVYLLRNDPLTQGPKLFGKHCASCHTYVDPDGKDPIKFAVDAPSAPNLHGFASRKWIAGLLAPEKIVSAEYFGNTAHKEGRMAQWLKKHAENLKGDDVTAISAALSAQAMLRSQVDADAKDGELITKGVALIQKNCANGCHNFGGTTVGGVAPDLTGYGSYEWLLGFVSDPGHARFYRRENDRMPAFAQDLDQPATHALSVREISLVVDWLRGEYYQASDEKPVLPHPEELARQTVRTARLEATPRPALVGVKPAAETQAQKAIKLFAQNCASCHNHIDGQGRGVAAAQPSAPNLHGFASRDWLAGLLNPDKIATEHYFGGTAHVAGDMVGYVNDNLKTIDDAKKAALKDLIAALSAEAALPGQKQLDDQAKADGSLERGRTAFEATFGCTDCHKLGDKGETAAPLLTGWGSTEWLKRMIATPAHAEMYGENNDRMPAFTAGVGAKKSLLTDDELALLVKLLRGEKLE